MRPKTKTFRIRLVGCIPSDGGGFKLERIQPHDIEQESTEDAFNDLGSSIKPLVKFLLNQTGIDYKEKIKDSDLVQLFDESGNELSLTTTFDQLESGMLVITFINDRGWPPHITEKILQHSSVLIKKQEGRIFIGHGRSRVWRELKDFIQDRLKLEWDEFNRESVAGVATAERLQQMLDKACFAFLVMTAEDIHADSTLHARENVIHEVGLFQGKLGFGKAIILLEEGAAEFSNITGLGQIRFPRETISACFEEIRRVLERESIM
jgi:hypothetical protein